MLTNNAPEDKDVRKPVSSRKRNSTSRRISRGSRDPAPPSPSFGRDWSRVPDRAGSESGRLLQDGEHSDPASGGREFRLSQGDKAALYSEASLLSNPIALVSLRRSADRNQARSGIRQVEARTRRAAAAGSSENVETKAQTLATQKG